MALEKWGFQSESGAVDKYAAVIQLGTHHPMDRLHLITHSLKHNGF